MEIKEAVQKATEYLREFYPANKLEDVLLEEVSLSDNEKEWCITLGFSRAIPTQLDPRNATRFMLEPISYKREYKLFKFDAETGKFKGMKIRDV